MNSFELMAALVVVVSIVLLFIFTKWFTTKNYARHRENFRKKAPNYSDEKLLKEFKKFGSTKNMSKTASNLAFGFSRKMVMEYNDSVYEILLEEKNKRGL